MFSIFGVTVILYFIKILCGNGDSDWTRSNVNAITDEFGLKLWAGCHGVIAVRCLFCNALFKMLNAHIAFYPAKVHSKTNPVSVQIQSKSASVNVPYVL